MLSLEIVCRDRGTMTNTNLIVILVMIIVNSAAAARRREDVKPSITEHPQSVVVPKNEPARLDCRAEGRPEPSISWLKDGEALDMSTGSSHITLLDTGALLFLSLTRLDVGTYNCVAQNRAGSARSHNATLEVAFLRDDFRTDPSDTVGLAGEPVVLECQPPRGYPEPSISWTKDDEDVTLDGDRIRVLMDGNLMISQARRTDTGSYVCVATNFIGTRRSPPAILNVHARPSFTHPTVDRILAAPGNTVELECVVDGDPVPTVTWSRRDTDMPQGRFQIGDDHTLRIHQLVQEDEGIYVCRAENSWGTETMLVTLEVNVEPTFTMLPVDQTISVSQTVMFQCRVTGSPVPAIFWQKDGLQNLWYNGKSYSSGHLSVSEEGDLQIQNVLQEDEGRYICSAVSSSGSNQVSAYLTVLEPSSTLAPVSLDKPPPIIRYVPSNQTYLAGAMGLIPCEASGDPRPTLQWSRNSQVIQTNARISVRDSGTLEFRTLHVSDSGLYTCTASNQWGQTSWSAFLQVVEEPSSGSGVSLQTAPSLSQLPLSPGLLSPSNITGTAIKLSWQPPTLGAPVTHYRLEFFSREITGGWRLLAGHIEEDHYLIQQLRPETTYLFLVRAANDRGIGPPSPVSQPVTTRDVGSESVELQLAEADVSVKDTVVLGNTEVKVTWQVKQHANLIEGYYVKYWMSSNPTGDVQQEVVIGETYKKLVGLHPDTTYSIAVQPFVGSIKGTDSPVASFTTTDVVIRHGSVLQTKLDSCGIGIRTVETIDSTTLRVTWQVTRHNVYIEGFSVRIQSLDSKWSHTFTIDNDQSTREQSELLKDLTPWTRYAVTVTPVNRQFMGQESQVFIAKTGPDVPREAPKGVHSRSNGSSAIIVFWQPLHTHLVPGILAGYYVYVLGNSTSQHKKIIANNESQSLLVSGLVEDKVYAVIVAGFTSVGSGPNSSAVSVRIPPAVLAPGPGDGSEEDIGGTIGIVVSQPWFISTLAGIMLVTVLLITVWLWRRRHKKKQSATLAKDALGKDSNILQNSGGIGTGNTGTNRSNSQAWAETQSWLHTAPRDGHDAELCKQTVLISDCQGECKEAAIPQPPDSQHGSNFDGSTLSTFQGSMTKQAGSPEYAVVESELHTPCCQGSYPRTPHLLCIHDTEPYASATLVLPANIREYAARRQKCSDTSSNSGSGCNSRPIGVRKGSGSCVDNAAYSNSGGSGVPALPKRDGSAASASDGTSLPSDSGTNSAGERAHRKKHRRGGSKQPVRNWTELLPPPPEQPPTDIDSPTGSSCPVPPPSHISTNTHMDGQCCPMLQQSDQNPFPPIRQHHPVAPALYLREIHHTYPGGVPNDVQSGHRPPPTNSLPNKLGNGRNGTPAEQQHLLSEVADRPPDPSRGQGLPYIATKRHFEDPRHEQLGKELLQFNDDMSQSEILSDTDFVPVPAAQSYSKATDFIEDPVYQPQSLCLSEMDLPVKEDLDTDFESESNCTDGLLGSCSSMNDTSSSSRHSSISESSDGSFFTDADFASAVAAAAQNSGMQVVGSTITDPRTGKKHSKRNASLSHAATNGHDEHRCGPKVQHKQPHRHEKQGRSKHTPDSHQHRVALNAAATHPTLPITAKQNRDRPSPVFKDRVVTEDTNQAGLTITANPMAFVHEKKETMKV